MAALGRLREGTKVLVLSVHAGQVLTGAKELSISVQPHTVLYAQSICLLLLCNQAGICQYKIFGPMSCRCCQIWQPLHRNNSVRNSKPLCTNLDFCHSHSSTTATPVQPSGCKFFLRLTTEADREPGLPVRKTHSASDRLSSRSEAVEVVITRQPQSEDGPPERQQHVT